MAAPLEPLDARTTRERRPRLPARPQPNFDRMTRLPILTLLLVAASGAGNLVVRSLLTPQAWPQPPVLLAAGLALAQAALAARLVIASSSAESPWRRRSWRVGSAVLMIAALCYWADTLTLCTPASHAYWLLLLSLHALLVGGIVALAAHWQAAPARAPQFSLTRLLAGLTGICLMLGLARWARPEEFGLLALGSFCAITAGLASLALTQRRLCWSLVGIAAGAWLVPWSGLLTGDPWSLAMLLGVGQGYLLLADLVLRIEQASLARQGIHSEVPPPEGAAEGAAARRLALIRT